MADDTAVSAVEAGMLAEKRSEQPIRNDELGTAQMPASSTPAPGNTPQSSSPGPAISKPVPPAPSTLQSEVNEPVAADSGIMLQLKRFLPYRQHVLTGLLVAGLLLCIIIILSTNSRLSALEKTLDEAKTEFSKRLAEQDKRFAEALHEKARNDRENRQKSIAAETLNRLRNGMPEQRLIRKKDGDWYVAGNKEEAVGNPEVIEILNNAYASAKVAERAGQIIPPHTGNAVCVLKPDGKGGTQVRTAYDFIVDGR